MTRAQAELPLDLVDGEQTDARALAAKVFERHGIALGEDDPAFALVTLNELILRSAMGELLAQVDRHIKAALAEFQVTTQRLEGRGGRVLAHQVRDSAAALQGTLREEIVAARAGLQQMVGDIQKTRSVATVTRWCAVAAVAAVAVFACGFWAGRM